MRCALGATLLLSLLGCSGPVEAPAILPGQVRVGAPEGGRVRVEGLPGAVAIAEATAVTLTVVREQPAPVAYALRHLNGGLPVASSTAEVRPDGSFGPVSVGGPDRPVQSRDELNLTPQAGVRQVGFTVGQIWVP